MNNLLALSILPLVQVEKTQSYDESSIATDFSNPPTPIPTIDVPAEASTSKARGEYRLLSRRAGFGSIFLGFIHTV